jgi:hypothetical protein
MSGRLTAGGPGPSQLGTGEGAGGPGPSQLGTGEGESIWQVARS